VLGEPQILGQVKDAFQQARDAGFAGPELTAALSRALAAAKRVRTETALGRAGVSWGHAVAELAEKVLGPLDGLRAAVVGAGEMAKLSARHLRDRGASLAILNRTIAGAEALAAEVGGEARGLDALEEEIARADVVVSAAPVAPAAFGAEAMARLVRARRRRIVLVDLAVPRAVPAETGQVADVYLCDVDDLDRMMRSAQVLRAAAAAQADAIVDEEVQARGRAEAERRAAPLIAEMRTRAAAIAKDEVERTMRRLGEDPELATRLDALAGAIVSKILHVPSARLRQAAREAVDIFDLRAVSARERVASLGARGPAPPAWRGPCIGSRPCPGDLGEPCCDGSTDGSTPACARGCSSRPRCSSRSPSRR
jgi:glutamyl-tRNA reductase